MEVAFIMVSKPLVDLAAAAPAVLLPVQQEILQEPPRAKAMQAVTHKPHRRFQQAVVVVPVLWALLDLAAKAVLVVLVFKAASQALPHTMPAAVEPPAAQ
jgi:hypothetical protein